MKKILIVSDTHRRLEYLEEVLEQEKPLDLLVHLGDVEGDEDYITFLAECPVEMVAGNNDFFSDLKGEQEIRIGKYRVLLTHGHYYYVNSGLERLKKEAEVRDIDIVMFGHIHRPVNVEKGNVLLLNPGSISYPRQAGRRGTYMVMELDNDNQISIELKYVD